MNIGIFCYSKPSLQYVSRSLLAHKGNDVFNYYDFGNYFKIELKNGNNYRIMGGETASRGCRFQKIYVEDRFDIEYVERFVYPSFSPIVSETDENIEYDVIYFNINNLLERII